MSTRKREPAWHRGLDRQAVAAEALRILDEEGRAGLTMRKLAASLDVEAASLYTHVATEILREVISPLEKLQPA